MLAALALLAAAVALSTQMRSEWHLVLVWGLLVGASTGVTSMVLAAVVATRWFDERRGVVLGALSAANATGQLVFLPLLASMADTRGWRSATLLVAAAAAVVFVVVLVLMRDRPEDLGGPYGQAPGAAPPAGPTLAPLAALRLASRTPAFSGCWPVPSSCAREHQWPDRHAPHRRHDYGISPVRSAQLLAVMGIFDILGTTASGWLTDRYSSRHLLFGYYTHLAALPARHALWAGSRCSTASTGSPRCHPRCV